MGTLIVNMMAQPKTIGFLLLAATAAIVAYSSDSVVPPFAEHIRLEESLKVEPKQSCTAKLQLAPQPAKKFIAMKTPLKCGIAKKTTDVKKCTHAFANAKTSVPKKETKSVEKTVPVDRKALEDACSHSEDSEARRLCMVNEVLRLNTYAMHIEEDDSKVEVIDSEGPEPDSADEPWAEFENQSIDFWKQPSDQ